MYRIDPNRTDLALEFKAKPLGPHGAELQKMLNVMRWQPNDGKYVLVHTDTRDAWCLGRLPPRRGLEVEIFEDIRFEDYGEGVWHLFKLRWKYQTGRDLEVE